MSTLVEQNTNNLFSIPSVAELEEREALAASKGKQYYLRSCIEDEEKGYTPPVADSETLPEIDFSPIIPEALPEPEKLKPGEHEEEPFRKIENPIETKDQSDIPEKQNAMAANTQNESKRARENAVLSNEQLLNIIEQLRQENQSLKHELIEKKTKKDLLALCAANDLPADKKLTKKELIAELHTLPYIVYGGVTPVTPAVEEESKKPTRKRATSQGPTRKELIAKCKALGITGYSNKNKADLQAMIDAHGTPAEADRGAIASNDAKSPEEVQASETEVDPEVKFEQSDTPPEASGWENHTRAHLIDECKLLGIRGYSKLKKQELIDLLENYDPDIAAESKSKGERERNTSRKADLIEECKLLGIKGYSKLKKQELIDLIESYDPNAPVEPTKPTPDELDSARLFYESLYAEDPESDMARVWLQEHGIPLPEAEE